MITDEVEILDVGRVRGRAVQHAELLVRDEDRVDGAVDVLERPAARRQEHRPAERRDVAEERHVEEISRRELERVDVELGQEVRARLVERRRDECDALLPRVPGELEPVGLRELEELAMLAVRRGRSCSRCRTARRRTHA